MCVYVYVCMHVAVANPRIIHWGFPSLSFSKRLRCYLLPSLSWIQSMYAQVQKHVNSILKHFVRQVGPRVPLCSWVWYRHRKRFPCTSWDRPYIPFELGALPVWTIGGGQIITTRSYRKVWSKEVVTVYVLRMVTLWYGCNLAFLFIFIWCESNKYILLKRNVEN